MKPSLRAALKWTRGALLENLVWKALSLLIAIILWAVVASEPELASFATVQVQFKNLSDELEISSEPAASITLELRGPSGELANGATRPAVVIDMTGVQPGERTFPIGTDNVTLPRGVRMVRAIPSEIRYRFERRATRMVPVVPTFSGEGQNGYTLAHWDVQPKELAITGPASHVAMVTRVSTDPMEISGAVGAVEFRVNAFTEEPYVRFQSSPQVTVAVSMKKR